MFVPPLSGEMHPLSVEIICYIGFNGFIDRSAWQGWPLSNWHLLKTGLSSAVQVVLFSFNHIHSITHWGILRVGLGKQPGLIWTKSLWKLFSSPGLSPGIYEGMLTSTHSFFDLTSPASFCFFTHPKLMYPSGNIKAGSLLFIAALCLPRNVCALSKARDKSQ